MWEQLIRTQYRTGILYENCNCQQYVNTPEVSAYFTNFGLRKVSSTGNKDPQESLSSKQREIEIVNQCPKNMKEYFMESR